MMIKRIKQKVRDANARLIHIEKKIREGNARLIHIEEKIRDANARLTHIEEKIKDGNAALAQLQEKRNEDNLRLIHIEEKIDGLTELALKENGAVNDNPDQWWGGVTYAQHGDDLIVLNIFHSLGMQQFSYIDIGANHPFRISNTALLYSRGNRGVNIEANPNMLELFKQNRPEDINLNVGIALENGVMPFYMIDHSSGRNSFLKEAVDQFTADYPEFKITQVIDVPVVKLETVIREYCINVFPDFLSMDIEGLDYDVLRDYDLKKNGPKVIDVEVESSAGDASDHMIGLLKDKGYFPYIRAGANVIFVRNEYRDKLMVREIV